jgi:hypothetical protein
MAKIFSLKELEERKKALVAESEVYRQTLTLEIQNLRLYGVRMQRKFTLFRLANPLLLLVGSLLGSRFLGARFARKRRGKWSRIIGASLLGWRLFRSFGPLFKRTLWNRFFSWREARTKTREEQEPASNI